ncbi:MAG TPA: FAD-dependent thymidylate synthase [Firmicutes bacterium]|nr:FAD-dependent thymidylate synthase [Bacillota bacterium]
MLDVRLAGYNVDTDILEALKKGEWDKKNNVTPETISAAYARISRDARPVYELRRISGEEVDKARKSNENIVFKMGHHSVAEHAMLNFDILGLSRFAVEYLQEARLSSYTEKSQRYITLEGDYVTPEEFSPEGKKIFEKTVLKQIEIYKKLFPVLWEYQKAGNPQHLGTKAGENMVEGWGKEDARYVLALATECQMGFSANARNLEHIIRKLKNCPLEEGKQLGKMLYDRAKEVAPSLVILADPEAFKKQFGFDVANGILETGPQLLEKAAEKYLEQKRTVKYDTDVRLIRCTDDPDTAVIAALLFESKKSCYADALETAKKLKKENRQKEFLRDVLSDLSVFDSLYRAFETVDFIFEIDMSSSAFAQMKRHRMMTIIKHDYDPVLGYTVPPSVEETGNRNLFEEIMKISEETYEKLLKENKDAAVYALTNAHKRRVLINVNLRELYHIARLRMDSHAQWDIRNISAEMAEKAKEKAPLSAALACGKDAFKSVWDEFFK